MTSQTEHRSNRTLRIALLGNGVFSVASGLAALVMAGPIAGFMGLATPVLAVVGVGVLGFGMVTIRAARQPKINIAQARLTTWSDFMWVVTAALLILGFPDLMTGGGRVLVGVVSVIVGGFAIAQMVASKDQIGENEVKELSTEIVIGASPTQVWDVLADLNSYQAWNPFIVEASGRFAEGQQLRLKLQPPGGRAMKMRPNVTEAYRGHSLEWWGHLGIRGIFDGRHRFTMAPVTAGTRLIHSERFTGILVPLLAKMLDGPTRTGFEEMNMALRDRVENRARNSD